MTSIFRRVTNRSLSTLLKRQLFGGKVSCTRFIGTNASNKQDLEAEIASYYGSDHHSDAYDSVWGEGNIHLGYYPHLEDASAPQLNFAEGADQLTHRMCDLAGVNQQSKLIDFGCGFGGPAIDIAQTYKCQVIGLDLTPSHIEKCKRIAASKSGIDIDFVVGSFTDVPKEIKEQKFTHVFSQLAIYHVAKYTESVIQEAHSILAPGGVLVVCDFTGCESGPSQETLEHFYKRLHLDYLMAPSDWCEQITHNGFQIEKYEQLNNHCQYGYELLEKQARKGGFISDDGVLLADNYKQTAKVIEQGYVGMNIIVARKV